MKIFNRLDSSNIVLYFYSKQKHFWGRLGLFDHDITKLHTDSDLAKCIFPFADTTGLGKSFAKK